MRFKSLKTQVLVWFGGVTTLILLIFNIAFYYFLEENVKLSIQNTFYDKAVFINNNIVAGIEIDELLKHEKLKAFDIAIVKEKKIVYKNGNVDFEQLLHFIDKKESFFVFNRGRSLNGLYIFRIYNPYIGAILFHQKDIDTKIDNQLEDVKHTLFILEPILLLLLLFVVSKLVNKLLRSIGRITRTANNISVTDLSQTIEQPLEDNEIKQLVDSFNAMIGRLRDEVELLDRFNSDVSHELKTPLTVIKGEIEITLNKIREPEYYAKSLKTIEYEASQIQTIVDNLLMLTKYTKENIQQTFEQTNLDSILLDTVDKYNIQLKKKNIKLHFKKFESVVMDANPQLIATIFSNLIDNAIKYTLNDKNIYISLYKEEDKIYFIIKDEGIGIEEAKLSKVLDRFYRVDESRNKKIKGFGLGLSIVKNCVELHNATIEINSKKDIGTTIKVIL